MILVYLGIAILNVIGTWFLMQCWGIIGAALMTGFALILGQGLVMNWYYHKKTGLEMIWFWKEVSKIYVVPVLLCTAALITGMFVDYYNLSVLLIGIVLYTVMFCLLSWILVMNPYEKGIAKGLLRRYIKK